MAETLLRDFFWGVFGIGMGDNPHFVAKVWLGD